jgi:hypothetical protein
LNPTRRSTWSGSGTKVPAIGAKTAVVSTSVGLAHEDLEPLASAGHAGRCVSQHEVVQSELDHV